MPNPACYLVDFVKIMVVLSSLPSCVSFDDVPTPVPTMVNVGRSAPPAVTPIPTTPFEDGREFGTEPPTPAESDSFRADGAPTDDDDDDKGSAPPTPAESGSFGADSAPPHHAEDGGTASPTPQGTYSFGAEGPQDDPEGASDSASSDEGSGKGSSKSSKSSKNGKGGSRDSETTAVQSAEYLASSAAAPAPVTTTISSRILFVMATATAAWTILVSTY
jgi:hypothetical protein